MEGPKVDQGFGIYLGEDLLHGSMNPSIMRLDISSESRNPKHGNHQMVTQRILVRYTLFLVNHNSCETLGICIPREILGISGDTFLDCCCLALNSSLQQTPYVPHSTSIIRETDIYGFEK